MINWLNGRAERALVNEDMSGWWAVTSTLGVFLLLYLLYYTVLYCSIPELEGIFFYLFFFLALLLCLSQSQALFIEPVGIKRVATLDVIQEVLRWCVLSRKS